MKEKKMKEKKSNSVIDIKPIVRQMTDVRVSSTSSLIVHNFNDKAKKQILDKQMGKGNKGREKKDPIADFVNSLYLMNGDKPKKIIDMLKKNDVQIGDNVAQYFEDIPLGFPASGFKNASVSACRNIDGIPMTLARGAFYVKEHGAGCVEIKYKKLMVREDPVRLSRGGVADIRYRGEFIDWYSDLPIELCPMILTPEQVFNLIDMAGFSVGVGDWRPEKDGSHGMFEVSRNKA